MKLKVGKVTGIHTITGETVQYKDVAWEWMMCMHNYVTL